TCIGVLGIGVVVSDPAQLIEKIRATLAPCRLGDWPTPLERAAALGGAVGIAELTVKREDRSSARYGGNKVRALEFLLAGARPGTVFVTLGGTGSTHCLAPRLPAGRDRPPTRHRRYCRGPCPRRHRTRLADARRGRPRRTTDRRQSLAGDVARTERGTTARAP